MAAGGSVAETALEPRTSDVAARFVQVWEDGDIEALLSLLTDDAVVMMPPMFAYFQGIETLRHAFSHSWELDPSPRGDGAYVALDLVVLTLDGDGRVRRWSAS